jgi:hypothetical protein
MKFFKYPLTESEEIKARRYLVYLFLSLFARKYRLELEHYAYCGKFSDCDS